MVLSTPRASGFVPSRLAMKTSLSVCSQLRFAWPGMARGKIWPGDLDPVTLGIWQGNSGLGGFPTYENSNGRSHSFFVHPHPYTHFIIRSVFRLLDFRGLFLSPKARSSKRWKSKPLLDPFNSLILKMKPGCQLIKIRRWIWWFSPHRFNLTKVLLLNYYFKH